MTDKTATTSRPINALLAARWSPRAFDPDRAVEPDELIALFEAARWAPSCYNEQPWRYLVWDRHADTDNWQRACDCLTPRNRLWASSAPVLALVLSKEDFSHNGKTNRWADYDAGQATAGLTLQASELGLHVHQMGGYDSDAVRERFAIPGELSPIAMMAIGHLGDIAELHEDFVAGETAGRVRKPLQEIVFYGSL